MCMLTKRTNILFDEELWKRLTSLAQKRNTSVGELVRIAVKETYDTKDEMLEKRRKAIEETLKYRPKPFKGKIDYKALINAGRKF